MNEAELYKELGLLTKDKSKWKESIPYATSLLAHESMPYVARLQRLSETDKNRVVRIHCMGAIKAMVTK